MFLRYKETKAFFGLNLNLTYKCLESLTLESRPFFHRQFPIRVCTIHEYIYNKPQKSNRRSTIR